MEKIEIQKFYKFRSDVMLNTFQIKSVTDCKQLSEWVNSTGSLTDFENTTLDFALQRYQELGRGWNEEELKMHFISHILSVANLNIQSICKTFFERPLHGTIDNYEMTIVTDCMVASPRLGGDPDKPFFFLQEYKQSQRFGRTDPEGQMLAAMLLAQDINNDNIPIYGCYVIEKQWTFTTIHNREYCQSQTYNSTKKADLLQIVFILRKLKELIKRRSILARTVQTVK